MTTHTIHLEGTMLGSTRPDRRRQGWTGTVGPLDLRRLVNARQESLAWQAGVELPGMD
ncbi:hypothetical protein [Nitrosococcus wardiae]|uniref:hypothetical protein n=1 Tax=Nitrosococcus wardiae TaxID=1814290 RepID=UPI00141B3FEA|nr:hypothetical protein [Nitrosococcus wardiae]